MKVLGINAVFHDPAAALVVDGVTVAAAEEERFSRRKHGKTPVPFSTWELPEHAIAWCLNETGIQASDLDAIAYSYDPSLCNPVAPDTPVAAVMASEWEGLRTLFAQRAAQFLQTVLPEIDSSILHYVPHHIAHAASAYLAAPIRDSAVLVLDGRGETGSHLAGNVRNGELDILYMQQLPHSLGLLYEEVTEHLGFRRSSDEYKVMAMASFGEPRFINEFRDLVRTCGNGGFTVAPVDWSTFAKRLNKGDAWQPEHADLASSVQHRLQEVLIDLTNWLHDETGQRSLTMAGGVALNCVANSYIVRNGKFDNVWVQPAAGDAGTALGSALFVAHHLGDQVGRMSSAALGPSWSDDELAAWLSSASISFERPDDIAAAVAGVLSANGIVAWFQGRSEFGPRALGHRSLLAHPGYAENLERLNTIKGREQFRPVAPMVRLEDAETFFDGPFPSPYMLFTHHVRATWQDRIPAAMHVDGTARVQTVDQESEPLVHAMLGAFEERTGLPIVINTSLNTSGRPMVDSPQDALECFGSAPIDALAIGPFLVHRSAFYGLR